MKQKKSPYAIVAGILPNIVAEFTSLVYYILKSLVRALTNTVGMRVY